LISQLACVARLVASVVVDISSEVLSEYTKQQDHEDEVEGVITIDGATSGDSGEESGQ